MSDFRVIIFRPFKFIVGRAVVGQPLNEKNKNIMAWFERVSSRPSSSA